MGGIPESDIEMLSKYWKVAPTLKSVLFKKSKNEGYLDLAISKDLINEEISNSKEFITYFEQLIEKVVKWEKENENILYSVNSNTRVKNLIEELSEKILKVFENDKLINKYDAYEFLMEYYNDTLKDDLHLIIENGWIPKLVYEKDKKGNIKKNVFDSDLLPKDIVIKEYYKEYDKKLEKLNNELINLQQEFENIIEENTGEDEIFDDEEKINEKIIKNKIKEETEEKIAILNILLNNLFKQKELKRDIKGIQEELNELIIKKYDSFNEKISKNLVIYKKWFKDLENRFADAYIEIMYNLSNKILNEVNNYENTLNGLLLESSNLEALVLKDIERLEY